VRTEDGRTVESRPPLRLLASYAVTAWTREVEDEHRLLSQVLAILYTYDTLPADLLAGGLSDPSAQPFPLRTRVASRATPAARSSGRRSAAATRRRSTTGSW
jgi:hypothetical protein